MSWFSKKHQIKIVPEQTLEHTCEMPVAVPAGYSRGRNRKLGDKCGNFAKVCLDSHWYCIRHAQVKALEILLNDN